MVSPRFHVIFVVNWYVQWINISGHGSKDYLRSRHIHMYVQVKILTPEFNSWYGAMSERRWCSGYSTHIYNNFCCIAVFNDFAYFNVSCCMHINHIRHLSFIFTSWFNLTIERAGPAPAIAQCPLYHIHIVYRMNFNNEMSCGEFLWFACIAFVAALFVCSIEGRLCKRNV